MRCSNYETVPLGRATSVEKGLVLDQLWPLFLAGGMPITRLQDLYTVYDIS